VGAAVVDYVIQTLVLALALVFAAGDFATRLMRSYSVWFGELLSNPGATLTVPPELMRLTSLLLYLMMGAVALYNIVFLGTWGATPGQRLFRMRVVPTPPLDQFLIGPDKTVPAEIGQVRLGWLPAVGRGLGWSILMVGSPLLMFQVFSVLMVLWHPRRQTIPDLVARTIVVRTPPGAGRAGPNPL
jgi:uncharacterized RDD family membrane protein YckC